MTSVSHSQNSKLSVLFQELPQSASAPSDEMPNYLVVSSFAIPAEHRLTCLEFSQQYLIAAYSVLKPDGSIMYYAQAFDLQSERSICVTHNAPIQRACISGKKLIVCFDTGSVGEHELEAVNPTQLVSRSYRSQLSDDLSKRYMFCCPLPKPSDQDNGVFPDVKCWIAPCYYLWTKSMTLSLYPIAFDHANISDPNEEMQSPPETNNTVSSQAMPEFQIPSSQPHEERQTTSWLPSNICRLTSYLLNSIQPKKLDCFRPMQSIAGQSNMLTHLRVKNPDRDLLVLSHASPAGRRGSDPGSCQSWATSYKPVQLLTREGQVKALGRSAKDSLLEFTWNEYTGRIVTATKNSTTSTITIATYEI
ncbi:hypothetical protein DL93DRAFT_764915 [Clavulina sp. PMI_390]|nr:hypothetical protein DL93DRAFT_764915 [Clavulina sp. PMI_390]